MNLQDIKIYSFNTAALTISMTNVDDILKMLLLSVSIGYTIQKWYLLNKRRRENEDNEKL